VDLHAHLFGKPEDLQLAIFDLRTGVGIFGRRACTGVHLNGVEPRHQRRQQRGLERDAAAGSMDGRERRYRARYQPSQLHLHHHIPDLFGWRLVQPLAPVSSAGDLLMSSGNDRVSRPPVALRPFASEDIEGGVEALRARIKLGPPLDLIATVREVLHASGCISSRAMANAPKKGGKVDDVVPQQNAP
jgi:hypothetical protein